MCCTFYYIPNKQINTFSSIDKGDLTPAGKCKESGCNDDDPSLQPLGGGRVNNVPICPITSSNGNVYVTMGGGGLFTIKANETPMLIVGEYGNNVVNGAGCAGVQSEETDQVYVTGGVSASGAGKDQSTFTLYAFNDNKFEGNVADPKENYPFPLQVFKDKTNTNTIGNLDNHEGLSINGSGQNLATTTRRDAHGGALVKGELGEFVHLVDRIRNNVEVFDTSNNKRVNTYDLYSFDGKSGREGPSG